MSLLLVPAQHVRVSVRLVVAQIHALNATVDFTFILALVQHAHRIVVPALAQLHALHAHLDFTFIKAPVCQLA